MSIGKEEAEKIIKDFNSIAPKNGKQSSSNNKDTQGRNEVKSSKGEHKDDDEKKSPKSNMKLIIIIVVIIIILLIGIYAYMYMGSKGKLVKKSQNPPVNSAPPIQTAAQ